MNSGFDRVNSLASDCDSKNQLLQVTAEDVRSSGLEHKDLGGFCLGRGEVGDSRLRRRELGCSRPTIRYRETAPGCER